MNRIIQPDNVFQFRDHEAKFVGSKGDIANKIEADTKNKIDSMNKSVASNKQKVIDNLISVTFDIKSQVHVNFRA